MNRNLVRSLSVAMALALCAGAAQAADTPEIEPNDAKTTATVIAAMAPGDSFSGSSNASTGVGIDTWDITTTAVGTPGIYQYRLTINTTGGLAHTMTLRGLTQTAGAINAGTDAQQQVASPAVARVVQWYANENPSRVYVRVTGTSTGPAPYTATLDRMPATIDLVPNPVEAGPVFITTIGQTISDTDMWLYDINFNPIAGAGNDNESVANGGPGSTTQSRLERTLTPGNYILAISTQNLANNQSSPADDRNRDRIVADFPNAVYAMASVAGQDNDFVIGNRCAGSSQTISNTASAFEVRFWGFTVAAPQLPEPLATFSVGSATPSNVGQSHPTLLSVTATGAPTSVTADLTAFGLSNAEAFTDPDLNGTWTYTLNVPANQAMGVHTINVTGTDAAGCVPTRSLSITVTPSNNACANAIPITVGGSYAGSTLGALNAGGLAAACNTVTGTNPGLWYIFTETSPTGRRLSANLCDAATNFNAKMVLYTGTCGALTCVWGNEESGFGCPIIQNPAVETATGGHSNTPVIINWSAGAPGLKCTVPGQTYFLCVQNTVAASGGTFVLHLDDTGETCQGTPPANNQCADARSLTTFPTWDVVFRNDGLPSQDVACNDAPNSGSRGGIWYRFTPTQNGDFFHAKIPDQGTASSTTDTIVTVFTAAPDCAALSEVSCVDAVEGYANRFTTPITAMSAGTTYYIMVSSFDDTAAIPGGENIGFNFVGTGPVTGACCNGTTCTVADAGTCGSGGGSFHGPGTACDFPGNPVTCCPANFNLVGGVSVQDIYDFLSDWNSQVTGGPIILRSADFNGADGVTVQDIYDFLGAWNAACPS